MDKNKAAYHYKQPMVNFIFFYASELMYNNKEEIDREKCFSEYGNFKMLHDKEINRLLSSDNKKISSMGI
ncbi:hypothetical protein K9O30_14805 [Clostridium bowmanii]|uniref:hypothetical protein n=1 Tax=Clostridium bowmanii TaxID=132925 RepID=UPI001C0C24A8|nr:hypothetical protein [Clostridium bowmanii]MBU3192193.1 hypothetical protein [Clostridium bowmanii]MCA1074969.1 hypothetical protein [Clostridium bowmanii]